MFSTVAFSQDLKQLHFFLSYPHIANVFRNSNLESVNVNRWYINGRVILLIFLMFKSKHLGKAINRESFFKTFVFILQTLGKKNDTEMIIKKVCCFKL